MSFRLEWLGHSTFLIKTPHANVIIDPFLDSNPTSSHTVESIDKVDLILLTHGHFDHTAEVIPLSLKNSAPVVSMPELAYLLKKVSPSIKTTPMGLGGTVFPPSKWGFEDILSIKMVSALHSSSFEIDGVKHYAGLAAGFIITLDLGVKELSIYHAGDTALHQDMKLLPQHLDIAMLPVDGHYNMNLEDMKVLDEWISPKKLIPMHYNTFPEVMIDPDMMKKLENTPKVHIMNGQNSSLDLLDI